MGMSQTLSISLAPLLATVAFAMVPATAQADTPPHWFLGAPGNASRVGESGIPNPLPTISWGTLDLFPEKSGLVLCNNVVAAGYVENPPPVSASGPAGVDLTESFNPYDCVDGECPAEFGLELQVKAEGLPWPSRLEEEVGPPRVIRDRSTEVELSVLCVAKGKYEGYPGLATLMAPPILCTGVGGPSNGEFDPRVVKGTSATIQTRLIFTGEPTQLECGNEAEPNSARISEALKTITYEKGSLYTAN